MCTLRRRKVSCGCIGSLRFWTMVVLSVAVTFVLLPTLYNNEKAISLVGSSESTGIKTLSQAEGKRPNYKDSSPRTPLIATQEPTKHPSASPALVTPSTTLPSVTVQPSVVAPIVPSGYEPPLVFVPASDPFIFLPARSISPDFVSRRDSQKSSCALFSCSASNYSFVEIHWKVVNTSACDRYHFYGTTFKVYRNDTTSSSGSTAEETDYFEVAPNWCRVALLDNETAALANYETIIYSDVDLIVDEAAMLKLAKQGKETTALARKHKKGDEVNDHSDEWLWLVTAKRNAESYIEIRDSSFVIPQLELARPIIRDWAAHWRYLCGGTNNHGGFRDQRVFNERFTCSNLHRASAKDKEQASIRNGKAGVQCWDGLSQSVLYGELLHCGSWLKPLERRIECMLNFSERPLVLELSEPPLVEVPSIAATDDESNSCVVFSCSPPKNHNESAVVSEHWRYMRESSNTTRECHRYHFFGTLVSTTKGDDDPVASGWCHVALLDDPESPLSNFETVIYVDVGEVYNETVMMRNARYAKDKIITTADNYDEQQKWKWLGLKNANMTWFTVVHTRTFVLPLLDEARPMIRQWAQKWPKARLSRAIGQPTIPWVAFDEMFRCSGSKISKFHGISTIVRCWNELNETQRLAFGERRSCSDDYHNDTDRQRQCILDSII